MHESGPDPDCVKTCTDQKSLEFYSNTISKSSSARHIVARKARRERRARRVGTPEFSRFPRRCIGVCQEASLAREGKNIWCLRTPFYCAAARPRFRTAKTHRRSFSHLHFDPKPDPQSGHSRCLVGHSENELRHTLPLRISARIGSSIWKVEPFPGVDSTEIRPPCISTISFAMASPNPVPPLALVFELST